MAMKNEKKMLPVDNTSPLVVLALFREFVVRNAQLSGRGAGSHHHPMWQLVANTLQDAPDGTLPNVKHGKAEWRFMQSTNTRSYASLLQEQAELAAVKPVLHTATPDHGASAFHGDD